MEVFLVVHVGWCECACVTTILVGLQPNLRYMFRAYCKRSRQGLVGGSLDAGQNHMRLTPGRVLPPFSVIPLPLVLVLLGSSATLPEL